VSTGFVASLAPEASKGLDHFIEEIKRRLIGARLVHVDETSDQVRRDTWWFHVAANDLYTYLFASPTRGRAAPDDAGVLLDFSGVMVHDRLSMYFNYDQATHAICMAHVLRDLAAVGVGWDQEWANDMATLLTEMNLRPIRLETRDAHTLPSASWPASSPATTQSVAKDWPSTRSLPATRATPSSVTRTTSSKLF
jgi:hypothetical protein